MRAGLLTFSVFVLVAGEARAESRKHRGPDLSRLEALVMALAPPETPRSFEPFEGGLPTVEVTKFDLACTSCADCCPDPTYSRRLRELMQALQESRHGG